MTRIAVQHVHETNSLLYGPHKTGAFSVVYALRFGHYYTQKPPAPAWLAAAGSKL
jgi:hypothetical protein